LSFENKLLARIALILI